MSLISNQRIEELLKEIRQGSSRIDLDHVKIRSPKGIEESVSWPFWVTIEGGRFVCRWRVPYGIGAVNYPEVMKLFLARPSQGQITETKDLFRLTATTNKGVQVEIPDLQPFPSVTTLSEGPSEYATGCYTINLPATGFETWESDRLLAYLRELNPNAKREEPSGEPKAKTETLFAIIPGVKLLLASTGTSKVTKHPLLGEMEHSVTNCLLGDIHGGTYCVESSGEDLHVYFRRALTTEPNDWPAADTVFNGVLAAIGFTHGCHPWPYYRQHVRDHVVMDRWVRTCPDCVRDPLLPIEKRRMLGSAGAQELFNAACRFFSAGSDGSGLTIRALWLMRESNRDSMPFEIRIVVLCSVLEGMIHRLCAEHLTKDETGRIKEKLRSQERYRKWKLLSERINLPWETGIEPAWKSWEQYRHPLAHGFDDVPEESTATIFDAYSRITGAIYILMARTMGFEGELAASALEDVHITLGPSSATSKGN